jgi:hypothetical protein
MDFAFGFRFSQHKFRMSFLTFTAISISLPKHSNVQPRDWEIQREASNCRRRVLRRDRYRCRGCDRDEREVAIAVHLVNPDTKDERDMLTLCRGCFAIVSQTKIVASHSPEFLRKLWTVLHSHDPGPAVT